MLRPWSPVVASSRDAGPTTTNTARASRRHAPICSRRSRSNAAARSSVQRSCTPRSTGRSPPTSASSIWSRPPTTGRDRSSSAPVTAAQIPWFGWLFGLPIRGVLARRISARGWWSPPDQLDATQLLVIGLLAAASMSAAFVNTVFTQTVGFAADDFGISETAKGDAGSIVARRHRVRAAGRGDRRSDRAPAGAGDRRLARTAADRARRLRTELSAAGGEPDRRSTDGNRAGIRGRRDRRRGDAAQQPGLCDQRARDGGGPRRRDRRDVTPAGRHRDERLALRLSRVDHLVHRGVRPDAPTARDPTLRPRV